MELVESGEEFAICGLRRAEGALGSAQSLRMTFRCVSRSSTGGLCALTVGKEGIIGKTVCWMCALYLYLLLGVRSCLLSHGECGTGCKFQ